MKSSRLEPLLAHVRETLTPTETCIGLWSLPGRWYRGADAAIFVAKVRESWQSSPPLVILVSTRRVMLSQTTNGKWDDIDIAWEDVTEVNERNLGSYHGFIHTTRDVFKFICFNGKKEYFSHGNKISTQIQTLRRKAQSEGVGALDDLMIPAPPAVDAWEPEAEELSSEDDRQSEAVIDLTERLSKIVELYKEGLLTDEEFASMKQQLLG